MAAAIKLGLTLKNFVPADEPIEFDELIRHAVRAEELGFSSLYAWDHFFLGTRTFFPMFESLTVLTAIATATSRIRLGTGVLVLPLRDPTILAKVTASIDALSNGRLTLGFAAGWYKKEFEAIGVPFERRGKILVRNLEIIQALWTEDMVTMTADGMGASELPLDLRRVVMEPKPVQKPRPPVLLGGYADVVLKRIAKHADGWLTYLYTPESFTESWNKLLGYAEEIDRDPATLTSVSQIPICVADTWKEADRRAKTFIARYCDIPEWSNATPESSIRGTAEECAEQIAEHAAAGLDELILMPAEYDIEQIEAIGSDILPKFAPAHAGAAS